MPRDLRSSALSALMGGQKPSPRAEKADESRAGTKQDIEAKVAVPNPAPEKNKVETDPGAQKKTREKEVVPSADASRQVARTDTEKQGDSREKGRGVKRNAQATASAAATPAPAADGYVGRSQYQRKRRGLVTKVAVHLSPDVAAALRMAGAVGDENGLNMSEIVETLLVQAGYGD